MLKTKGCRPKIKIDFASYPTSPSKPRCDPSRWNQELFQSTRGSKDLQLPLKDIEIAKMDDDKVPLTGVHALVPTERKYCIANSPLKPSPALKDQFPEYETVTVGDWWVKLTAELDLIGRSVESDIESFGITIQSQDSAKNFEIVMAHERRLKPRVEFQTLFDVEDLLPSERNRITNRDRAGRFLLEGLQEDTFSTRKNSFICWVICLLGATWTTGPHHPVSFQAWDGEDGVVHIARLRKGWGFTRCRLVGRTEGRSQ